MIVDLLSSGASKGGASHLTKVIHILVASGFYIAAWESFEELIRVDAKAAAVVENDYPFLGFTADYLARCGLGDLEVSQRVLLSSKLVVDAGFRLRKFSISAGNYGVSVELSVAAELERLVDLNFSISDAIASSFDELISEHVTTGVVPWEVGA
jgi:hypothetical protein